MRAIVTGGCGFIGHSLSLRLHELGYKVIVLDSLVNGAYREKIPGVNYIYCSITDKKTILDLFLDTNPNVVFHLAAVPRVSYSVSHPYESSQDNLLGTISILDAIRQRAPACRLVFSSSSSVYGDAPTPTTEREICSPKSPYGLQKLHSEEWCRLYAALYGLDIAMLRYFNVFGPGSLYGGAYSTVLSAWLYHLCVDSDSVPYLEGDGSQTRDFCFIDNVVKANILAAEFKSRFKSHVFNIAQGESHSLLYIKDLLEKISGKKLQLDMRAPRIGDIKDTLADISHAKNILKYTPDQDFDAQVTQMFDWYTTSYPQKGFQ